MVKVLGIDPGSGHIGLAVIDVGDQGFLEWVSCATVKPGEVTTAMLATYKMNDVAFVVVEAPVGRPGPWIGPVVDTAMIAGEIYGMAMCVGLRPTYVTCSDWRKVITGRHNASDAQVKVALEKRMVLPKRTNAHVRDAAGVAAVGGWRIYCGTEVRDAHIEETVPQGHEET